MWSGEYSGTSSLLFVIGDRHLTSVAEGVCLVALSRLPEDKLGVGRSGQEAAVKRVWLAVVVPGLLLMSIGGGLVQAQGRCSTVVASGLVNPRFLAFAEDGTLYVSEAGSGGTEVLPVSPSGDPSEEPQTRGRTGQVTRIGPGGTKTVVASGLPSYGAEGFGGPAGLVASGGMLWLAAGGPAEVTSQVEPLSVEGAVVRIDPRTGTVAKVADVLAYEKANNPDPYQVESNLYGLALGLDGSLYTADAGGNAVYRVDPRSGQVSLVAVIPGLPISREDLPPGLIGPDEPVANPDRGDRPESDPVPTSVAVGPDGTIYVGLLTGFPFLPGRATVLRVTPSGELSDAVTGLTMVASLAFGPDRLLYVSQLSTSIEFSSLDEPPSIKPGNVLRVLPNGRTQVVADGLNLPHGIAFDQAGNLYVGVNSTGLPGAPPPAAPEGQVLRCDGVAAAAQPPAPAPSPPPAPAPRPAPAQIPSR